MAEQTAASSAVSVSCACKDIELVIEGTPVVHLFCHCDDCQLMNGGAYSLEAVYAASAVKIVRGNPMAWTLKRNPRTWCPTCGVHLFIDVLGRELRGVNGLLLPKHVFRPSFHQHCRFAILPILDDLPHYRGRPPLFDGSGELVEW